jgi:hypothetical protein
MRHSKGLSLHPQQQDGDTVTSAKCIQVMTPALCSILTAAQVDRDFCPGNFCIEQQRKS